MKSVPRSVTLSLRQAFSNETQWSVRQRTKPASWRLLAIDRLKTTVLAEIGQAAEAIILFSIFLKPEL